jgi:hypothetical protein
MRMTGFVAQRFKCSTRHSMKLTLGAPHLVIDVGTLDPKFEQTNQAYAYAGDNPVRGMRRRQARNCRRTASTRLTPGPARETRWSGS